MATCKDCIHYDICIFHLTGKENEKCAQFLNKADVVEVETIKSWLYAIAINNVGINNNGDFSDACEEIISRLDGLRRFAKERSSNE